MLCHCATVLSLYVWREGHGGGRGRLLYVSVFWTTDFCRKVRLRSHHGGWGLHQFTLGTCGSRPSEAREREAWARLGLPPFPIWGVGGGAPLLAVFSGVTDICTVIGSLCPSILSIHTACCHLNLKCHTGVSLLLWPLSLFWRTHFNQAQGRMDKGCNGSGCNVRIRLQPRLLPTAFTAYCPLFEPMSADRPHMDKGGGGGGLAIDRRWSSHSSILLALKQYFKYHTAEP